MVFFFFNFTFFNFYSNLFFLISKITFDLIFMLHDIILGSCLLWTFLYISLQLRVKGINFSIFPPLFFLKKLNKILIITLFFYCINPFIFFFTKSMFNNLLISTPQIIIVKVILVIFCILILKCNFFFIFIEKIILLDFGFFFG
jgi:hypothetical protein